MLHFNTLPQTISLTYIGAGEFYNFGEDILLHSNKHKFSFVLIALGLLFYSSVVSGQNHAKQNRTDQEHPNSPVFKDYKRPPDTSRIFKNVDESYQLWQSYFLSKEANEGNPLAEHELAIRYLTGKGFPVDTPKCIYWMKKAADQNLPAANYNYAIFLHNGWGVKWNPFEAYKHFLKAAQDTMLEAQYVVGLLLTDNLVVSRNLSEAYQYIKKAALRGYKPAQEVLNEFIKRGIGIGLDPGIVIQQDTSSKAAANVVDASWGINYLGLDNDSTEQIDDRTLLKEVLKEGKAELGNALGGKEINDSTLSSGDFSLDMIKKAAGAGSPEAQTLLGRCYEKGIGVKKDLVLATVEYIKAIRLESPRSPRLLWFLIQQKGYFDLLKTRIDKKDADAQFAYAGLVALGYNFQIPEADALKFLEQAAEENHVAAINELGLCYYTGNLVKQDKTKAIQIWRKAEALGSIGAKIRIAMANLQNNFLFDSGENSIAVLKKASEEGSLLAQAALAKCYESGIVVEKDIARAVHLYRLSAQRGSQGANRALKRLYDGIRPKDEEFTIHGEE